MTEAQSTTKTTSKDPERDAALRKAYSNTVAILRESHRDEFNRIMAEQAKRLGYEWTPKPTAKDKAAAQLQTILAEHPDLAATIVPPSGGSVVTGATQVSQS